MGTFTAAARTWATDEVVTAANLNAQLRDLINGFGAWTAYTPVWSTASTQPVLNNGTIDGKYLQIGKLVIFRIVLTMGSTTTYGTATYRLSLPVAPVTTARIAFMADYLDSSASAAYQGGATFDSATGLLYLNCPATTAGNPYRSVTATVPMTWATGDIIAISGTYESA